MEDLTRLGRDHRNIRALLEPKSIALVGASDDSYFSQRLADNLLASAASVDLHFVSPSRKTVHDQPAVPGLDDVGSRVDQVIALVSEQRLGSVLADARRVGARSGVVLASQTLQDASEDDPLDARLLSGMSILGSGSLGYIGAAGRINAVASHFPRRPLPGRIALISQSGGLAVAAVRLLDDLGSGVSFLVTVGAEKDLDAVSFLQFAVDDPGTEATLMILEGVRRPTAFISALRAARAVGKPVVILKLGQSDRGSQMAVTHTGALAGNAAAFAAICRKHDATLARDLDEAVDVVSVLDRLPRGHGVGDARGTIVVTASGAAGIAAADAAERASVDLPEFGPATARRLSEILPGFATVANPLDVTAQVRSDPSLFELTTEILSEETRSGAIAFVFALGLPAHDSPSHQASFEEIARLDIGSAKPLVAASIARTPITDWGRSFLHRTGLPYARSYDAMFKALDSWYRLSSERAPEGGAASVEIDIPNSPVLDEVESKQILAAYGILAPGEMVAETSAEALGAAKSIGYPVSLKLVSASLPHKAEAGAVKLGIDGEAALLAAIEEIAAVSASVLDEPIPRLLVSPMVAPVAEVLVGAYLDEQFGPMVVCGHGGSRVESLGLTPKVASAPIGHAEARAMIAESGVARAAEGGDIEALASALVGVSRLISETGRVTGVDINPVAVLDDGEGALALDALIETRSGRDQPSSS